MGGITLSNVNYMRDNTVRQYYEKWELNPFLVDRYKEDFYRFVRACLMVDRTPDIDHLKSALRDSFYEKYEDKEKYDQFVSDVVVLFEHLRNFANTRLP